MNLQRQESLISLEDFPPVSIIGCGGIGSWIALFLTLAGIPAIDLWDADQIADSNLHRTPYRVEDIGKQKSVALSQLLKSYRSSLRVVHHGHWREGMTPLLLKSIVVAAIDGIEMRKSLLQTTRSIGSLYYDVGAEATGYNFSDSPADWQIAENREGGYYTPIFIGPVTMCAAQAAWWILRRKNPPAEFRFTEEVLSARL